MVLFYFLYVFAGLITSSQDGSVQVAARPDGIFAREIHSIE
jgi:hypothetical protein